MHYVLPTQETKMKMKIKQWLAKSSIAVLVGSSVFGAVATTQAAALTSMSDNLSRLQASTAANHTIQFVTPTGLTGGQTITITFSSDFTGVGSIAHGDVDLATAATCSGFSDRTLGAGPSGATWGVGAAGQVITLTSGTDTITAGHCVQIEIGTNATHQTTGSNQISNGDADDDDTITIAGTFGDTGTISVDIIADDTVDITATVAPSITFAISDTTIGFGTLSAASARYATGDTNGTGSETEAHNIQAGTNATGGYVVYMVGPTLTSGADTITAIGASNTASAPGTEQFGVRFDASGGSGTVQAPYAASGFAYNATSSPVTIAAATGATATTTYSARYIANITANTEAGSYSTSITYTATATF